MRIVYKRSLTFIVFLIVVCLTIGICYLFYDKVITKNTIVMVDNELSINYINGNKISSNGEYKFSITNNSENEIYYSIFINNINNYNNKLTYSLSSSNSNIAINPSLLDQENTVLISSALIKGNITQDFVLKIANNEELASFTINVTKNNEVDEFFYATILNNNEVKNKALTQVGSSLSITNEGLIEEVDDTGMTYYFRGAVPNNYVSFANNLWRIIRINGDGTIRMILDDTVEELSNYSSKETSEDLINTDIYNSLKEWYDSQLMEYDQYIVTTKYCSEAIKENNIYNTYTRLITNVIPTFNCLGDKISSNIGLITADEVAYAGGNFSEENTSYYLYNKNIETPWWTSSLAKTTDSDYFPFIVNEKGQITSSTSGTLFRSLRPVITLNKRTIVTGEGTLNKPYTIIT